MRTVCTVVVLVSVAVLATAETITGPHVRVDYSGINPRQARSIAKVISTARQVYVGEFAADMPATVIAEVKCGSSHPTRLYTDGRDHIFLSLFTEGGNQMKGDVIIDVSRSQGFELGYLLGHSWRENVVPVKKLVTQELRQAFANVVLTDPHLTK